VWQSIADFSVREAHNTEAGLREQFFSLGVTLSLRVMNSAIDFDRQPVFDTAKIKHEGTDWMLPTELESVQASATQLLPQASF
jgi:hypothetical protein